MKKFCILTIVFFLIWSLMLVNGCTYDVTEPVYKPVSTPITPIITGINPPDSASPGVNTITIQGQNFSGSLANTSFVYFDNYSAEVVGFSTTSITVRRPNYVVDLCSVRVVSPDAWWSSQKFCPYRIVSVLKTYCRLPSVLTPDQLPLTAIAVDNSENLFITRSVKYGIFRVDTTGKIDSIAKGYSNMTDVVVGLDNRLYMLGNSPSIRVMPLPAGTTTTPVPQWVNCGKSVKYGDFAANGYFFAGGVNTSFVIISPTLSIKLDSTYITSSVTCSPCSGRKSLCCRKIRNKVRKSINMM